MIAMLPIFSHYDLAQRLHDFSIAFPKIHLQLEEIEERDLSHKIDFHDYDSYLLRGVMEELHDFQRICLYEDILVAVVSIHHPYARKEKLLVHELEKEPLLFTPHYTCIANIAMNACLNAGFQPMIKRHGRIETLMAAVNNQEGIALVMSNSLTLFQLKEVVAIPFETEIHGDIYLYFNEHSKHQDALMKLVSHIQS